jgi:hypothetical protein
MSADLDKVAAWMWRANPQSYSWENVRAARGHLYVKYIAMAEAALAVINHQSEPRTNADETRMPESEAHYPPMTETQPDGTIVPLMSMGVAVVENQTLRIVVERTFEGVALATDRARADLSAAEALMILLEKARTFDPGIGAPIVLQQGAAR